MTTSYDDFLARRVLSDPEPSMKGASGYFSPLAPHLDPHLFNSHESLWPDVRRWILSTLYGFWSRSYDGPHLWSRVWIAGSGATYQWSAGREAGGAPGDLDILIGVHFSSFFALNPSYRGFDNATMAAIFNDKLKAELWPATANASPPRGGVYEATWYVNPGGADIHDINAYAAYDVERDEWTIRPPDRAPSVADFGAQAWEQVNRERDETARLAGDYIQQRARLMLTTQGSGEWVNAVTSLHDSIRKAHALFDSVHGDRHRAFEPGGKGFTDYYNFRWQAHKRDGTVSSLHTLAAIDAQAHQDFTRACYPTGQLLDAEHALVVAALAAQHP